MRNIVEIKDPWKKGKDETISFSHSPKRPSKSFLHLVALVLIIGVAWVGYANTFYVPFYFDDYPNILQNRSIHFTSFSLNQMGYLLGENYGKTIRLFSYFTFALNYYFGKFNVFGYHLTNLIIHIASGIFLYWFLILTFRLPSLKERYGSISFSLALFTSLIFISHPIQTQSVTYIVQRMTSMAGMFYLLSMLLYLKGRLSRGKARYYYFGGLVLSYILGVFTKENVAILPFFIVLFEFYFFQNFDLSRNGRKMILFLGGGLLTLLAVGALLWGKRYIQVIIEGYQYRTFTMWERVLTQFQVVLYYLTLIIYPHPSRLNVDHDFSLSRTILDPPTTLISMLVIGGLIGYSIWRAKRRPVISFFILWYFGNLAIESSIFPLEIVFEHRLYLPSVGPFLLFSLLTVRGMEMIDRHFFLNAVKGPNE